MFVFPAFDTNYKTRKRTFKCCQSCRAKRIKCEITLVDYETAGCANCRKHGWVCDLVSGRKRSLENEDPTKTLLDVAAVPQEVPYPEVKNRDFRERPAGGFRLHEGSDFQPETSAFEKTIDSAVFEGGVLDTEEGPVFGPSVETPSRNPLHAPLGPSSDMRLVSPLFLKDTFNFNILGQDLDLTYQYLFHDHPRAIIANKTADRLVWHELGVYVEFKDDEKTDSNKYKPYKVLNFGGLEKVHHIRKRRTYDYLLSINAFTLWSPEYQFDEEDIRQMVDLYFFKLNSVFPIIHAKRFVDDFKENKAHTMIVFAIVLAISRDPMAEPILRRVFARSRAHLPPVSSDDPDEVLALDYAFFATDLEGKIRQLYLILPELGDVDKLTRLIVLLLLSLHFKFDRLCNEQSSHDLTLAVNLAISLGIHMKRPARNNTAEKMEYSTNLWWCCFVFDRLNAVTNSRCLFINNTDFNVDLPYSNINLLRLVQVARSVENVMVYMYRPFNDNGLGPSNSLQARMKMIDIEEFQNIEFDLCDRERIKGGVYAVNLDKERLEDYLGVAIHFFTRLINNTSVLLGQKGKYDDHLVSNHIPEANALKAGLNILWYLRQLPPDFVLNIPILPYCISLAMAVSLKLRVRELVQLDLKEPPKAVSLEPLGLHYDLHDYMEELEKFSGKWWVVDEVCKLCRDFTEELEKTLTSRKAKRSKQKKGGSPKRRKLLASAPKPPQVEIPQQPKSLSIPSIRNLLQLADQNTPYVRSPVDLNDLVQASTILPIPNGASLSPGVDAPTPGDLGKQDLPGLGSEYDEYLGTMQTDLFVNEFFKDVPNLINFLK